MMPLVFSKGGSMAVGLMTKLDAVNRLLAATGDSPVQSLSENYQQAELAEDTLDRVSRNLQSKGWWFNEDEDIVLSKDVNNNVVLPNNILNVHFRGDSGYYVQRGTKVYDRENQTYTITEEVKGDTVIQLEWDELPHQAREAIVAQAAYVFYKDFFGSEATNKALELEIDQALVKLSGADIEARDINLLGKSRIQNIAFTNRRSG